MFLTAAILLALQCGQKTNLLPLDYFNLKPLTTQPTTRPSVEEEIFFLKKEIMEMKIDMMMLELLFDLHEKKDNPRQWKRDYSQKI